jgi:hypothetical protein
MHESFSCHFLPFPSHFCTKDRHPSPDRLRQSYSKGFPDTTTRVHPYLPIWRSALALRLFRVVLADECDCNAQLAIWLLSELGFERRQSGFKR